MAAMNTFGNNKNCVAPNVATRSVVRNNNVSVLALFAEKLDNAKQRFLQHFLNSGISREEVAKINVVDVMTELLAIKMYWDMIRSCDTDFFMTLNAAKPPPAGMTDDELNKWLKSKQIVEQYITHMQPDELAVVWRYINFFVSSVQELTK